MSILLKEKVTDTLRGFREFMEQHQAIMVIFCMVMLGIALAIFVVRGMNSGVSQARRRAPIKVPFIDLTTGKVFMAGAQELSPITSPDGNEAVRIRYYQCRGGEKFVGYYEKYSEKYKKAMEESATNPDALLQLDLSGKGILMMSVDGKKWYDSQDPKFIDIQRNKLKCPDGTYACEVLPE